MNANTGYDYNPDEMFSIAFFPVYPLFVHFVTICSPFGLHLNGLIVSHLFLLASLILLHYYVRITRGPDKASEIAFYTIFTPALFPTLFWLHMTYSETTFLFFCLLTMYGMERRWLCWFSRSLWERQPERD